MVNPAEVIIVGQGPNEACWRRELAFAERVGYGPDFAERCCARLAVTGAVGRRLAWLMGVQFPRPFINQFNRQNLNARWNGKNGKGDSFDAVEGCTAALKMMDEMRGKKVVLLGLAVAKCFGVVGEWLATAEHSGVNFLVLPHPSGINRWWNEGGNERAAMVALRAFCGLLDGRRCGACGQPLLNEETTACGACHATDADE
ncbi:MAG: hypothetical protein KGL39_02835 [Patescibacteria group bacterium]|nr:hypothetical protein [Patescibacteria group bacterium]